MTLNEKSKFYQIFVKKLKKILRFSRNIITYFYYHTLSINPFVNHYFDFNFRNKIKNPSQFRSDLFEISLRSNLSSHEISSCPIEHSEILNCSYIMPEMPLVKDYDTITSEFDLVCHRDNVSSIIVSASFFSGQ